MANLTYQQLFTLATQAGFTGGSALTIAAIAMAESGGNPLAVDHDKDGSTDHGVLQINDKAHPDVSVATANNPLGAFQAAYKISEGGTNFYSWTTYKNGKYVKFMPNDHPWTPYNSANQKAYQNLGINPHTGKPFQVSNPQSAPIANKGSIGAGTNSAPSGNILQQAGGAINNVLNKDPFGNPITDASQGVQSAANTVSWFTNPLRVVKILVGVLLIGASLILILIPEVSDTVVPQAKTLAKKSIKNAVYGA
jgi:Lysozyme like domain